MTGASPSQLETLRPGRRFGGLLLGWTLMFLATPGCVLADGTWMVAALGMGIWGAFSVRPLDPERRRRSLLAAWLEMRRSG